MVYLIQIGHETRRGAFNKLHEKVILVEDDTTRFEVETHFKGKYEGFEVIVKQLPIEKVFDIEHFAKKDDEGNLCPQSCIGDFTIQYTKKEKEFHDQYVKSRQDASEALFNLHKEIEKRYKQLFYSDIRDGGRNHAPIEFATDDYCTRCLKFPVKAELFIEAAQKCDGLIPTIDPVLPAEPTAPTLGDSETDSYAPDDIPF